MDIVEIKLVCLDLANGDLKAAREYFEWVTEKKVDTKYEPFQEIDWKRV
mgnify:FL=1